MKKIEAYLECVRCHKHYDLSQVRYNCECGGILDLVRDLSQVDGGELKALWESRWGQKRGAASSGVWRYKELIFDLPDEQIVTRQEGNTRLYDAGKAGVYAGLRRFQLKHEGENPTGSFKDRGMTCGTTAAKFYNAKTVACASTGNTSASMASYAAVSGMESVIFIPEGKIAYGKLAQALAYGGRTLQIRGNFDDAMALVQEVCRELNIYLLNSINPFRIEGQKAIGFEILQQLDWQVPDWFVIPGGNLGNNTALSKGMKELYDLGIIDKIPRLAVIQAARVVQRRRRSGHRAGDHGCEGDGRRGRNRRGAGQLLLGRRREEAAGSRRHRPRSPCGRHPDRQCAEGPGCGDRLP